MSFLEKSRIVRAGSRWYADAILLKPYSAGSAAAITTLFGYIYTDGLLTTAITYGAATIPALAPLVSYAVCAMASSRHTSEMWVGADILTITGKPADVALVRHTEAMISAIARKDEQRPHLSAKAEARIQLYLQDLEKTLPRLKIEKSDGSPATELTFYRHWTDKSDTSRTEKLAILHRHPDDIAYQLAVKESEDLAYAPAKPFEFNAPAADHAELRAAVQQTVAYLEARNELDLALRIKDTVNENFAKLSAAEPAPKALPAAQPLKIKR